MHSILGLRSYAFDRKLSEGPCRAPPPPTLHGLRTPRDTRVTFWTPQKNIPTSSHYEGKQYQFIYHLLKFFEPQG